MHSKNEVLFLELDVSQKYDFMDGFLQQIILEYTANEELVVTIVDGYDQKQKAKAQEPLIKVPLKISEIIDLDNGTAYLGFVQETVNLTNVTLIENWAFHSNVKSNQKDPWSGLSLKYTC
jgi:hypothetical protein